jgi:hypothetical protein
MHICHNLRSLPVVCLMDCLQRTMLPHIRALVTMDTDMLVDTDMDILHLNILLRRRTARTVTARVKLVVVQVTAAASTIVIITVIVIVTMIRRRLLHIQSPLANAKQSQPLWLLTCLTQPSTLLSLHQNRHLNSKDLVCWRHH